MSSESTELSLVPSALPRVLAVAAVLLLAASVAGQVARLVFGHDQVKGLVPLFYVDGEENIPSYFSVVLLLTTSFLLAVTTVLEARRARSTWPWALLSSGFLLMGYDEAFQLHELMTDPARRALGAGDLGIFTFAWVVPGLVLVCLLLLILLRFLVRLPARTRRRFLLAGAVYIGGSIGMELVGGWIEQRHGLGSWQFVIAATIEEGMEMAGLILFIWALLQRWADDGTRILLSFTRSPLRATPSLPPDR